MDKALCAFCSPERTYLAIVEPKSKGLELDFIATTSVPIDLENLETSTSEQGLNEFYEIANKINSEYDLINFSIPIENTIVSEFPARPNITNDEITSIINIEIRQNYPQFNPQEFPTYLFELSPRKNQPFFLSIIIPKLVFTNLKAIANKLNKPVQKIEISQINAHNAFLYNYPEERDKTSALFNIADKFIDFSLLKGTDFIWYSLIKYNFPDEIPQLINDRLNELSKEINFQIDSMFFFGSGLNKILFNKISNTFSRKNYVVKRLNAFRMFTTRVDETTKAICARLAHHFPACIGSAIPDFHKRIKIY
jgi:hypothetical protein